MISKAFPSKKSILITVVALALIPVVAWLCYLAGDTNLYLASVLILILAMVPFIARFEGSKPDARSMSILAVMVAITVASRVLFMFFPSFKPMGGFVVIAALAFGPQAGFMTGAMAMLISNIVFGQGPWTPWQMFCYGMIGLVAGLLGKRRILSEKHAIRSAIITFFIVLILSSAVLDTGSVFMLHATQSIETILVTYVNGIIFNVLNGIASAICIFLLIKPMTNIINRIKLKYDINF